MDLIKPNPPHLPDHLQVKVVGRAADEFLASEPSTRVIGILSQGIYLLAENRRVVFVSFGSYRSPLTLNLGVKLDLTDRLKIGSSISVKKHAIIFHEPGIRLLWEEDNIWQPPSPPQIKCTGEKRILTLNHFARDVLLQKEGEYGFAPIIEVLLKIPFHEKVSPELDKVMITLKPLQNALKEKSADLTCSLLEPLLGYGRGLTPSGDDFVTGILLAMNRYSKLVCPGFPITELNSKLISSAQNRTTHLSVNILEQAAQGYADERLLTAIDQIMLGEDDLTGSIQEIIQLGHSSGIDTLAGIILVLLVYS